MPFNYPAIALSLLTVVSFGVVAAPAVYAENINADALHQENLDKAHPSPKQIDRNERPDRSDFERE